MALLSVAQRRQIEVTQRTLKKHCGYGQVNGQRKNQISFRLFDQQSCLQSEKQNTLKCDLYELKTYQTISVWSLKSDLNWILGNALALIVRSISRFLIIHGNNEITSTYKKQSSVYIYSCTLMQHPQL